MHEVQKTHTTSYGKTAGFLITGCFWADFTVSPPSLTINYKATYHMCTIKLILAEKGATSPPTPHGIWPTCV
jgi:hypothetical protein